MAKRDPTTGTILRSPRFAGRLHSSKRASAVETALCSRADGSVHTLRATLSSILTLSTAAGASAIVVGDALRPKPAKASTTEWEQIPIPPWPDAHIHVAVARLLPEVQECQRFADVMREKRRRAFAELGMTPNSYEQRIAEGGGFPRLAAAFAKHGYYDAMAAWREAQEAVSKNVSDLAILRPKTLSGFIAKARIARYQPELAIHMMRDLNRLDEAATA